MQHGARARLEVLHDLRSGCSTVVKALAALLLVLAAGCRDAERQGLTADTAVMQTVGTGSDSAGGAAIVIDPVTTDSAGADSIVASVSPTMVLIADSVAGDVLFRRKGKCLSCHGLSGKGIDALGPNLQDSVWLHGDGSFAFIQRTIVEGIARPKEASIGMPSFGRPANADASVLSNTLSPEEIHQIAAYVYTLSNPGSAVADTSRVALDSLSGQRPDSLVPPVPPPARSPDSIPSPPDTIRSSTDGFPSRGDSIRSSPDTVPARPDTLTGP